MVKSSGAARPSVTLCLKYTDSTRSTSPESLLTVVLSGNRICTAGNLFIADLGPLIEAAEARSLYCRDMHKHVLAAAVGLNKPIPLGGIEPLHSTCRHVSHSFAITIATVELRSRHWARKTRRRGPTSPFA